MTGEKLALFQVSQEDAADIERWFSEGGDNICPEQLSAMMNVIRTSKVLALTILRNVPRCADRSAAIRKVREAMGTAIEAVRHERGAYK